MSSPGKKEKFLLCRPQGGLNDLLCQIEKCCRYAELNNRTVIVDTKYIHSEHFHDDFSRYFLSRQRRLLLSVDAMGSALEQMAVFPAVLQGRLHTYQVCVNKENWIRCEATTEQPITFDFREDYSEQLLVHHQAGGGSFSQFALLRLTLRPELVDALIERVQLMRCRWVGVHVRNTDYSTRYEVLLHQLRDHPPSRLFLATDSLQVKEHFQKELSQTELFSFTKHLSQDGRALHAQESTDALAVYERNRDALLDLLTLALSDRLFFEKIQPNVFGASYSGFSKLAQNLWAAKPVLHQLINDPRIQFGLN